MKRNVLTWILVVTALSSFASAQTDSAMRYILHNERTNQWCAYSDQKRWSLDIDEDGALEVASVTFLNTYPSVIKLTQEDNPEAGDWTAYDTYQLNNSGEVISLIRITNVLPGDLSRTELFKRRQGRLLRQSVTTKSLSTGKPVAQAHTWFPGRPLVSNVSAFPFAALLQQVHDPIRTEPLCIKAVGARSTDAVKSQ